MKKTYLPHTNKYILLLLVLASFVLIFWGIFTTVDYNIFLKKSEPIMGVITDADIFRSSNKKRRVNITVEYTVDGTTYEIYMRKYARRYNATSPYDFIGGKVSLLYDVNNPQNVRKAEKPYSKSVACVGTGIMAAILCYVLYKKNQGYDKLLKNGIILDALIIDAKMINESSVTMSERSRDTFSMLGQNSYNRYSTPDPLFVLTCEYVNPVTGQRYEFKSIPIKEFVQPYIGSTVKVHVDPDDYSQYFVDVNDILSKPFTAKNKPFTYKDFKD